MKILLYVKRFTCRVITVTQSNTMKLTEAVELHGLLSSDVNYSSTAIFADENGYRVESRRNDGKKIVARVISEAVVIEVV